MGRDIFRNMSFTVPLRGSVCRICTGECDCESPEAAKRRADAVARVPAAELEIGCKLMVLRMVGRRARQAGATIWLESHDGKRRKKITADNPVDLVDQADGFDNDNDAWIVWDPTS